MPYTLGHCATARDVLRQDIVAALLGASLSELAHLWVRQLLAYSRRLLLSLDQHAQDGPASITELASTEQNSANDAPQVWLSMSELAWDDGLQQLACVLTDVRQAKDADTYQVRIKGDSAANGYRCPARRAYLPLSSPELQQWWETYSSQTRQDSSTASNSAPDSISDNSKAPDINAPSSTAPHSHLPAICVRDLLMTLGLPRTEALLCQRHLQPAQVLCIMEAMLPARRQCLLEFLHAHFGPSDGVFNLLRQPEMSPSFTMEWVSVDCQEDRAAIVHFTSNLPTVIARGGRKVAEGKHKDAHGVHTGGLVEDPARACYELIYHHNSKFVHCSSYQVICICCIRASRAGACQQITAGRILRSLS